MTKQYKLFSTCLAIVFMLTIFAIPCYSASQIEDRTSPSSFTEETTKSAGDDSYVVHNPSSSYITLHISKPAQYLIAFTAPIWGPPIFKTQAALEIGTIAMFYGAHILDNTLLTPLGLDYTSQTNVK